MSQFSKNIKPFVEQELQCAKSKRLEGNIEEEFKHLENAHVLGQNSTWYHVKVHCLMFAWGMRQKSIKEVFGQLLRIVGAATKTALKLVPAGNTGGSNISPFKPLPLSKEHAQIIERASKAS